VTYWLKLPIFVTPISFGPLHPMFPLEFRGEVNRQEIMQSWGLSYSEDRMIVA